MYVHVSPETLRKYPWIGVSVGLAGVLLMGFVVAAFWSEWVRLRSQAAPEEVTVEEAFRKGAARSWVRLTGGAWDCASLVRTLHRAPESWILGRVEDTQVRLSDSYGRVVILKFDGAIDCAALGGAPVEGMLVHDGDKVWGGGIARPLRQPGREQRVLCVGSGPRQARNHLLLGSVFCVLFAGFAITYAWIWIRQRGRVRRTSEVAPILPR